MICRHCEPLLVPLRGALCMRCGKALESEEKEYCEDCAKGNHLYERGAALYTYPSSMRTIYRFKYLRRSEYAEYLGKAMARLLGEQILAWQPDGLVPIPLHPARQRSRGYNQAALLAEVLGRELHLPVYRNLLIRTRNTVPQKLVSGENRQNNLRNAFITSQNIVKLDTIVIIDDIYTTGSTVDAAAAICLAAGVRHVYYAALSIGEGIKYMVNEDRVAVMTRMAAYEQKEGRQDEKICRYFRTDYIGFHVLKNWIGITIACMILLAGYLLFQIEDVMVSLYALDMSGLIEQGKKFIGVYIIICVIYAVIITVKCYLEYEAASRRRDAFEADLEWIREGSPSEDDNG